MSNNFQIIVLAKKPMAGYVKTRMNPQLDKYQSARLAELFLMDTIDLVDKIKGKLKKSLFAHPESSIVYFESILKNNWNIEAQRGKNLGARITNAVIRSIDKNDSPVIVLGSDSPALPGNYIDEAAASLKTVDVVVGPCVDGGFYLVGVRKHYRGLFTNIRWGSEYTLFDTIQKINKKKLTMRLLPVWFDIDNTNDLLKLKDILEELPVSVCVNTRKELKNILKHIN